MSERVVTLPSNASIRQAANLMRGRGIGCLAVVDGTKPIGIVTITDLLELIGRGVECPVERSKRWTLARRGARDARPGTRHARRS
jgi:CBS domain-containing protein